MLLRAHIYIRITRLFELPRWITVSFMFILYLSRTRTYIHTFRAAYIFLFFGVFFFLFLLLTNTMHISSGGTLYKTV